MNTAQFHRGPDAQTLFESASFVLGNTRLAIQDPRPEANQPFVSSDGRYVLVFNGEVYNFRELAKAHALDLRTGCDGEVVVALWQRHGPAALRLLRGMFALAVADLEEETLHLARDPFGIKPLYWRSFEGVTLFASEVKPLWRIDRALTVSSDGLRSYFERGAIVDCLTPFDGIHSIPPGGCVRFARDGASSEVVSIDPFAPPDWLPPDDTRLVDSFRQSVALHLVSDVQTGLLLSAGVDSSLVAAAAAELGHSLLCLTVTGPFGEDESPQAQATAAEFGHTHVEVPASIDGDTVDRFFEAMQSPSIDGLNTFLVCRAVHEAGLKVALSGLGADEALAGYSYARLVRFLPLLRLADSLPSGVTAPFRGLVAARAGSTSGKLGRLIQPGGPRGASELVALQRELFDDSSLERLGFRRSASDTEPAAGVADRDALALVRAELHTYLRPMLLHDADSFSMGASVEIRVPFVDRGFMHAAVARNRLVGKRELVAEFANDYLTLLAKRRKTGFEVPMRDWMRHGVLHGAVEAATEPSAPLWEHVDAAFGRAVLSRLDADDRWSPAWSLVAFDSWLRSL